MAIENVGSMKNVLQNLETSKWLNPALEKNEPGVLSFKDNFFELSGNKKSSFMDLLTNSLTEVNDLQVKANKEIQKLVSGESKNIHETLLSVEKADLAFKTMNQIRGKIIDAYQSVMKMQI